MNRLKTWWQSAPQRLRRPIILVTGSFFILLSGAVGWLPGPGGIPVFLLGIAILATEFAWAESFRDRILGYVHAAGEFFRAHPFAAAVILTASAGLSLSLFFLLSRR